MLGLLFASAQAQGATLAPVPPLTGYVMDAAHLLTREQAHALAMQLRSFERETGRQVATLTVPSVGDEPIEAFALRAAEQYKLGRREGHADDGVLLVVAVSERRARIEVGQGLEGLLPDVACGRIINDVMAPAFARGAAPEALVLGLRAIMDNTRAEGAPQPDLDDARPQIGPLGVVFIVVLLGFMMWAVGPTTVLQLLFVFGNTRGRNNDDRFGGRGGRFGGGGASGGW